MPEELQPAAVSAGFLWAGRIITGLVALFMALDGGAKLFSPTPVVEASEKLGIAKSQLFGIGVLLLACTMLYVIPQTSVLGAILLTAFLGGATAIHVRAESGAFPIAFSVAFGGLAWLGLVLRDPRLFWMIVGRS